ncbi:MAG TPA: putative Ig domain-containing protein, partial [Blastocatellia bacterium]
INTTAALPANVNRTTETLNGSLLAVTGDTIFEPNETVLLNGSSCTDCMFADNQGVATIQNDDCPTSFTVNDLGDAGDATPGNNVCETATGNGVCTLRAALQEANALTACTPFTINFSVMGTITLGSALPAIAHPNLTINGPGAANLTVSGNNLYRVLEIASGSHNVNLSGLTLANGYIKAADTTAMSGTNQAPDGLGGGLYSLSTGAVNVTDCVITNNTAQGGNATGGTNVFGGEGIGAGIYLQSGTGTAKLTRCTISNNSALGGLGMGGTTQTLDGTGRGAGVYKHSGSLTVEDCTIADNITDRIDGSVLSSFTNARGAGLFNASGALAVTGSTFSGNRRPNTLTLAGAAIQNTANITWTMTNSTFSGNTGSNTIVLIAGTLTMVNCTVANNTLSTTISSAGAIFNQIGSTLNLKNTLLGNNTDGPNIKNFGTVTSQGNNFDSDGTTTFTNGVNGDIVGTSVNKTDPLLSRLGNYGGLTQTQALLPGSPAINAGTSSGAPATDQRGITRVGNTDIGAFESRGFTLAIAGGNNQSAVTSTAFANPLAVLVTSAFSEPVNGGQITFTLPGSGPSANLANNPATITGGTATTGTVTANAVTGGPYPVAATTNGAPAGVNFFLTNTCQTITVSPATLAGNATTGQTFTQTFTQMNGTGAITWSLIGTAPPGLSFDAMTATLSGSPSASGSFNFTVRATDGNNCFGERQYTLGVDCQTVTLSPMEPALAGGTAGTPYSQSFTAAGGALPHNFSVSGGTLPTGLMLAANGALTGTPTAFGNFNFTVRATDANECFGERAYTVRICGVISLTVSLPNGTTGVAYSQTITASGGAPPSSFAVTAGSLPPGLSLNGDGTLSGTPTQSGSFTFTVTATDPLGCTGSQNYIVNIGCQTVTIDQTVLTNGFAGTAYNQTLTATGGTAPYSFAVSGGALPGGINLSSGGALSGLPTTQSTFNFTVRATDAYGCFGEQSFTVLISGDGLMFYPLPSPVRLLDTRAGLSPNACSQPEAPISGGTSRTQMARNFCGLPANAQAITGNITTVQSGGGYLTLYPSDAAQPLAANSNYEPNEILNNVFTVGLGAADGAFKIFVTSGTDVVIDVTGYYAPPAAGGLFFHPLPKPIRLLETRNGFTGCNSPAMPLPGGVETAQNTHLTCDGVTIPTTARAITGNATTVSPTGPGFPYLTLFPADAARPLVANSNYLPGQIMNAPFTVGLNAAGEFKIYPTTQTDLVIDVLGYFSPEALDANGAGLLFTPLGKPVRLLETRAGFAGCFATGTPLLAGSTQTQTARGICNGETVTATALGIVGNVTVVNAESGYLTFWPSTALQPTIATSNFSAGQIFNRHFTAGLGMSDGAFKIFTQSRTDLVIDVSGFFAP